MESACNCCQKKQKTTHESVHDGDQHTCKCRSRDEHLKIDPEIDQVAAAGSDESASAADEGQASAGQNQAELKSRIIQSIKDSRNGPPGDQMSPSTVDFKR